MAQQLSAIAGGKGLETGEPKPELTSELRQEIRDVLPAVVAFGEYKMYKWHYSTGDLGSALGLVEELIDIDPEAVHDLDLQPTLDRLINQAAALSYDVSIANAPFDRRETAPKQLEWTRNLLG